MANIFLYGSLMAPEVWERVAGASAEMHDAVITDHARYRVEDALYPAMVPQPGSSVSGKLILDLPEQQLDRLNKFEGIGDGFDLGEYQLTPVRVECDGAPVDAMTYMATPELRQRMTNEEWDPVFFALRISDYMKTIVEFERALVRGGYELNS